LVSGADIELKSSEGKVGEEWVLILGAAGSVGQYAVQVWIFPSKDTSKSLLKVRRLQSCADSRFSAHVHQLTMRYDQMAF